MGPINSPSLKGTESRTRTGEELIQRPLTILQYVIMDKDNDRTSLYLAATQMDANPEPTAERLDRAQHINGGVTNE